MSNEALTWAWGQRLPKDHPERERVNTSTAKFVLVCLADQANADGVCWPGQESIGVRVDRDPRTVREALAWLRSLGLLSWIYRNDPVTKRARSTVYRLHLSVILGSVRSGQTVQEATGQSARSVEHDPPGNLADEPPGELPGENPQSKPEPKDVEPSRPDVQALIDQMSRCLTANGVRFRVGKTWHDAGRLLLDADGRDLDEALHLIEWATSDVRFWRANILSLPTFRAKYDALRLQADRRNGRRHGRAAEIIEGAMGETKDRAASAAELLRGGGS